LGELVEIADTPAGLGPYGPVLPPCSEDVAQLIGLGGPFGAAIQPFGAEPEFTVSAAIMVTYSLR
jgi:hypothetical protein